MLLSPFPSERRGTKGADATRGEQRRVHAESLQMIPDSEKRLAKAVEELEALIVRS